MCDFYKRWAHQATSQHWMHCSTAAIGGSSNTSANDLKIEHFVFNADSKHSALVQLCAHGNQTSFVSGRKRTFDTGWLL
jgi:hypothetical protein